MRKKAKLYGKAFSITTYLLISNREGLMGYHVNMIVGCLKGQYLMVCASSPLAPHSGQV